MRCWVLGCWVPGCLVLGCLVLGCLVLGAGVAHAQALGAPSPRLHHATVAVGASWAGTYSVGDTTATLRTNAPGATPVPFTLFSASHTIDQSTGVLVRAGFALTKSFTIEGGGSFAQPSVVTRISQDAEQAVATEATERLHQFVIDAGALWHLPVRLGSHARLFASGGGGYLRQLHEERTLVETGSLVYAGAGVNVWLRGGHGPTRSLGFRTDLRANWRHDGVEFDGRARVYPTLTAAVFVGL